MNLVERFPMTITFDPAAIAAFIGILLTAAGGFIWFGKLRNRIDTVATDVKELKADVKQVLAMLHVHQGYHQGLGANELPADAD